MISGRKKVLYIVHGHPDLSPGGGELAAYYLYQAMRASALQPYLLFRVEGPARIRVRLSDQPLRRRRSRLSIQLRTREYDFFQASGVNGDALGGTSSTALRIFIACSLTSSFPTFPVHRDRSSVIGAPFRAARRIVMTLHEFLPICRTPAPCSERPQRVVLSQASRVWGLFPQYPPWRIFLRRHMRANLALVDKFITPSRFLRERFIAWGIAPDRIVIENGRPP